jgi:hypothetical protein
MEYQNRLTCFIDLLGFKSAIDQSLSEPLIAKSLFEIFEQFRGAELEKVVYGTVPYLTENGIVSAADHHGEKIVDAMDKHFDLVVTQFSDSFVISAPANNTASCNLLLRALRLINIQFFFSLGMLMRGGISVGKLVHKRGGALFGPAMNEAYAIESKSAIYPRVVVSDQVFDLYSKILVLGSPASDEPFIKRGFDGVAYLDLVSCFLNMHGFRGERTKITEQFRKVEEDILQTSKASHPKIAYLLHQWSLHETKFFDEESTS